MGDKIEGNVGDEALTTAIGKDIQTVSIYSDRLTWRDAQQREFAGLHQEIIELRGWVRGLLIAVCIAFALGFLASVLAIRQFDLIYLRVDRNTQRIESLERRIIPPVPISPIP